MSDEVMEFINAIDEYKRSLFGKLEDGFETCAGCHMPGRKSVAAAFPGARERTVHEHLWPGVDVALSPRWTLGAGYRTIEGGADVESVYNFAWLHFGVVSVRYGF